MRRADSSYSGHLSLKLQLITWCTFCKEMAEDLLAKRSSVPGSKFFQPRVLQTFATCYVRDMPRPTCAALNARGGQRARRSTRLPFTAPGSQGAWRGAYRTLRSTCAALNLHTANRNTNYTRLTQYARGAQRERRSTRAALNVRGAQCARRPILVRPNTTSERPRGLPSANRSQNARGAQGAWRLTRAVLNARGAQRARR